MQASEQIRLYEELVSFSKELISSAERQDLPAHAAAIGRTLRMLETGGWVFVLEELVGRELFSGIEENDPDGQRKFLEQLTSWPSDVLGQSEAMLMDLLHDLTEIAFALGEVKPVESAGEPCAEPSDSTF